VINTQALVYSTTQPNQRDRVSPHPLSTYLQPVHLAPSTFDARRKVYVWSQGNPEGGTFEAIYQRLLGIPGWQTHKVPYSHDLVVEASDLVVDPFDLLLKMSLSPTDVEHGADRGEARTRSARPGGAADRPRRPLWCRSLGQRTIVPNPWQRIRSTGVA